MDGMLMFPRPSVDQMAGPTGMPMAATVRVTFLTRTIFNVVHMSDATAGEGFYRGIVSTAENRSTGIHTLPAHSSGQAPQLTAAAMSRAIGHKSGTRPIGDTTHALTPGRC
jgi:hypothetical protein